MSTKKTIEEKKEEIIKSYLSTPQGRMKLAQSMANPIRGRITPSLNMQLLRIQPLICPVCDQMINDIFEHSKEFEDDEHKILSVVGG
jgi:hypothetical protein